MSDIFPSPLPHAISDHGIPGRNYSIQLACQIHKYYSTGVRRIVITSSPPLNVPLLLLTKGINGPFNLKNVFVRRRPAERLQGSLCLEKRSNE